MFYSNFLTNSSPKIHPTFLTDKNNEPPEFASKALSKFSITTANANSIIINYEKGRKKKEKNKQKAESKKEPTSQRCPFRGSSMNIRPLCWMKNNMGAYLQTSAIRVSRRGPWTLD